MLFRSWPEGARCSRPRGLAPRSFWPCLNWPARASCYSTNQENLHPFKSKRSGRFPNISNSTFWPMRRRDDSVFRSWGTNGNRSGHNHKCCGTGDDNAGSSTRLRALRTESIRSRTTITVFERFLDFELAHFPAPLWSFTSLASLATCAVFP